MQKNTAFAKGIFFSLLKICSRTNLLFIMRLSVCFGAILVFSFNLFAAERSSGQSIKDKKISYQVNNKSLKSALDELQDKSGFSIFYPSAKVNAYNSVTVSSGSRTVEEILLLLLKGTELDFGQDGNKIVLFEKTKPVNLEVQPLRHLSGIVVDVNDNPLPGVTVSFKLDRETYTATDENGQFGTTINNERDTLIFSFIGYFSQKIPVTNIGTSIKVILKPSDNILNEVVVIGYGTSTRRDLTGAVSSIAAADIAKQPVQDPLNALEGRVAGAVITQSNGLPGASVNILVRGTNSLGAGTVPLYIIDGVPFNINDGSSPVANNLNSNGSFIANGGISPFSVINPNDIERIDILKDADATAIYGARGGNGVVLITTKKGKAGKTTLDVNLYQGVGKVANFIPMLNTPQYLALRHEAITNDGLTPDPSNDLDLLSWDTTKYTNWQKKYMGGTAHLTDLQASVSGGSGNTSFIFTNGVHRETTVFPGDFSDQKYTSRFSMNHGSADKKFNMNLSINYAYDISALPSVDLSSTYNLPPNYPLYNADGTLYWDSGANFVNPQSYFLQKNTNKTNSLISNLQLRYTLLPGLDLKLNTGYNNISLSQVRESPAISQSPVFDTPVNSADFATSGQSFYSVEPQIDYSKLIGKGKLTLLAGSTLQRSFNQNTRISATGYSNPDLMATPAGASNYTSTANSVLYKFSSVFGRVNYNWDDKYLVNATLRTDGSSRFGANHPFGTFYSVGGAWIFTKEDFFKNNASFLSFGKLKASYGVTGNDQIGDYQYLPVYYTGTGSSSYQGNSILYVGGVPNPNLEWETDKKMDFGLDLGFINDRIVLGVDYYRNRSSNQLGYLIVASQSGVNSYAGNLPALLQNKGLEFELNTVNVRSSAFQWRTSINLTIPRNQLLSVSPDYYYATSYVLGYPVTQQSVFNYAGPDPTTGLPSFKTKSGSLTTNPDYSTDRTVIEDPTPKLYGGISNDLTYGNFSLSFFFQFTKQNGQIYHGLSPYPGATPGSLSNGNQNITWLSRWNGPGSTSSNPIVSTDPYLYTFTYGQSSAVWGDNSFVKLKNAALSYNVPSKLVKKLGMDRLKIFSQGQNLFTWTKNKIAFDPETGTSMPPLRIITFGLNATF